MSSPRILIGCETSGTVRDAFLELGYDAWSCDILPSERPSNRHIQADIRTVLNDGWDLLAVMHPPCTRLCNSGVRWLKNAPPGRTLAEMWAELDEGAALFSACWNAPIPLKAVENPVMHKHAKARIVNYRKFGQSVQPWMFGDFETKRTCFWLEGLKPLQLRYPTLVDARAALGLPADAKPKDRVFKASPGVDRWRERSRFFPTIASAMAEQWGAQAMARLKVAA